MTPESFPTEPCTVIRVTWRYLHRDRDIIKRNDADWQHAWGDGHKYTLDDLVREVAGFTVLSSPVVVPQTDVEYGWTAQQWRDWSLKLSAMLPEDWDGDEDELSIIESFVRHAAQVTPSTLTPEEAGWAADWHDHIVDQGGDVPEDETELALRLRGASS